MQVVKGFLFILLLYLGLILAYTLLWTALTFIFQAS